MSFMVLFFFLSSVPLSSPMQHVVYYCCAAFYTAHSIPCIVVDFCFVLAILLRFDFNIFVNIGEEKKERFESAVRSQCAALSKCTCSIHSIIIMHCRQMALQTDRRELNDNRKRERQPAGEMSK